MARRYQVTFENVTVSAAQDLVLITGAAGKMMRIVRAWVNSTNTTAPTNQQIRLRARVLPATVTVGSGGTTGITPSRVDPGDAACSSATCGANNTTQATTSGTAVVLYANGANIFAGEQKTWQPGKEPTIGPSEAFVWELLSTVTGTVAMSGGVEFDESGG